MRWGLERYIFSATRNKLSPCEYSDCLYSQICIINKNIFEMINQFLDGAVFSGFGTVSSEVGPKMVISGGPQVESMS